MQWRTVLVVIAAVPVVAGCSRDAGDDGGPSTSAPATTTSNGFLKYWQPPGSPDQEAFIEEPLPPGFQVLNAPLEGPVFADTDGQTLYIWPLEDQRNGQAGRPGGPAIELHG